MSDIIGLVKSESSQKNSIFCWQQRIFSLKKVDIMVCQGGGVFMFLFPQRHHRVRVWNSFTFYRWHFMNESNVSLNKALREELSWREIMIILDHWFDYFNKIFLGSRIFWQSIWGSKKESERACGIICQNHEECHEKSKYNLRLWIENVSFFSDICSEKLMVIITIYLYDNFKYYNINTFLENHYTTIITGTS